MVFLGLGALVMGLGYYHLTGIGNQTIQLHLRLYGASIYEYHTLSGRWPSQTDDLARTSLARHSPYWKAMLEDGAMVILWPKKLKADPQDNPDIILAYHNAGLLASVGWVWVCWGDLRTEYIRSDYLQDYLRTHQE